jgi:hypothetical protein
MPRRRSALRVRDVGDRNLFRRKKHSGGDVNVRRNECAFQFQTVERVDADRPTYYYVLIYIGAPSRRLHTILDDPCVFPFVFLISLQRPSILLYKRDVYNAIKLKYFMPCNFFPFYCVRELPVISINYLSGTLKEFHENKHGHCGLLRHLSHVLQKPKRNFSLLLLLVEPFILINSRYYSHYPIYSFQLQTKILSRIHSFLQEWWRRRDIIK